MENIEEKIEQLRNMVAIQSTDGNWNYSQYMRGYCNGLMLALSLFEDVEPDFKDDIDAYIKESAA